MGRTFFTALWCRQDENLESCRGQSGKTLVFTVRNGTLLRPCPWKAVKEKAGEVRSDYGNLWNARSARGGDPKRLLLKDKPFPRFFTLYIQTTPYLIAFFAS